MDFLRIFTWKILLIKAEKTKSANSFRYLTLKIFLLSGISSWMNLIHNVEWRHKSQFVERVEIKETLKIYFWILNGLFEFNRLLLVCSFAKDFLLLVIDVWEILKFQCGSSKIWNCGTETWFFIYSGYSVVFDVSCSRIWHN